MYAAHRGTPLGRWINLYIHPEDTALFENIEAIRNFGVMRMRLDEIGNDWVPPRLRKRRAKESRTEWVGDGSLETLEEQVKRKALLVAGEMLERGTDEQRMRVLAHLASIKVRDKPVVDDRLVTLESEFEALLASVRDG